MFCMSLLEQRRMIDGFVCQRFSNEGSSDGRVSDSSGKSGLPCEEGVVDTGDGS